MSGVDKKSEDTLLSTKGKKLFCRYWCEDGLTENSSPKALCLIVHGFAEHSGPYQHIAKHLESNGFYVFGHDNVGHGHSEGERAQIEDFSEYVQDIFLHVDKVKQRFPDIPVFLIAHSMGGTIGIKAVLENPDYFKGVVFISPLVEIDKNKATTTRILIGRMISRLFPNLHLGKIDPKEVSRDQEFVKQYSEDPLVYHTGMKSRIAMVIYDTLNDLKTKLSDITCPFLVLHGDKDAMCDIEGSKQLHEKAKSTDKQIKIFEDAFHQLHNEIEPVKSETYKIITDWLNARC